MLWDLSWGSVVRGRSEFEWGSGFQSAVNYMCFYQKVKTKLTGKKMTNLSNDNMPKLSHHSLLYRHRLCHFSLVRKPYVDLIHIDDIFDPCLSYYNA